MFKLALNLNKTVAELSSTMSYYEFLQWQDYYNQEPFLADRLEVQLSKIGYTNLLVGMNKLEVEEDYFFVSKFEKQEEPKSPKDLEQDIKNIFGVKE